MIALLLALTLTFDPFEANAGQCTEYVSQYVHETRGYWMNVHGDARWWASSAAANGWTVDDVPEAGSILVTQHGTWGHVAIVREANESEVYVEDANWYGDGGVHHHWLKRTESDRYIHLSW